MAVIFFTVSGGPYGLEPLLGYAGNSALLLLLITPILWDLPTIFTVLEMNSMMPVTGGYYQWVKKAMGLKWAFFEGWWTWLYTFADLAIYPVLFVGYASFFIPGIEAYRVPICLLIIWGCATLNILGIVPVGKTAQVLVVSVLVPFILLFIYSFLHGGSLPHQSFHRMPFTLLGMSLYTIMWNFIGWDSATTYAEEVDRPVRTYLTATISAFIIVVVLYAGVILATEYSGISAARLAQEGFPAVGVAVAGQWLGALISLGGMASSLGLFCAVLLSVSRVPEVMAQDGLLPAALTRLHKKYATPYLSIIICAAVVSLMILWTFGDLLIIDITIYGAGLMLEFAALILLRKKFPEMKRPFKIPLGIPALIGMSALPLGVYLLAMAGAAVSEGNMLKPLLFAFALLFSAVLIWYCIPVLKKWSGPLWFRN